MLTAREIMNTSLVHLEHGTSVNEAAQIMAGQHIGSIIVTANGYPIGIVTETDLTKAVAGGKDLNKLFIEEIMSSPLFSTSPDADMTEVASTMTINRIKKMPVLEHQRVIGIITQTDIIKHILEVCAHVHEQYKNGKMDAIDFAACSAELYRNVKSNMDAAKHWHMRCTKCGYQFLNEERGGRLTANTCPRCNGPITYDQSPPI